jgi:hypothetical protein
MAKRANAGKKRTASYGFAAKPLRFLLVAAVVAAQPLATLP